MSISLARISAYIAEARRRRPFLSSLATLAAAVLVIYVYLAAERSKLLYRSKPVGVVTASSDISAGVVATGTMIEVTNIPRLYVEPDALTAEADVLGKMLTRDVKKGTQVCGDMVADFGPGSGISGLIPEGMRAVTIPVDRGQAAGMLRRGDRIDVFATFDVAGVDGVKATTFAVAEGLNVIYAGGPAEPVQVHPKSMFGGSPAALARDESRFIVVVATPANAQDVEFAKESGKISVVVRPVGDSGKREKLAPSTALSVTGNYDELRPAGRAFREYRGR
jgi:Flp pilus assembly protein CpaB